MKIHINETTFYIKWNDHMQQDMTVVELIERLLKNAMAHLTMMNEGKYPFPKKYDIIIGRRRTHANIGAEMHLSQERLQKLCTGDASMYDLEQSLIIHELVHNLTDDEDLPMLAELHFMIEHEHFDRLEFFIRKYNESTLPETYRKGLERIAKFLDKTSVSELQTTALSDTDIMKKIFKEQIQFILKEMDREIREGKASTIAEIRL